MNQSTQYGTKVKSPTNKTADTALCGRNWMELVRPNDIAIFESRACKNKKMTPGKRVNLVMPKRDRHLFL